MKKFVAILALPIFFVAYYFAAKFYIAQQYLAAYSLVLTSLVSIVLWILNIGLLLKRKPAVVAPAVPRAYITNRKAA